MSMIIRGDSIAVGIGQLLGGAQTTATVGAVPAAIAGYDFPTADWTVLSMGSNGNDAAGMPALNAALATVFAKSKDSKWIFILPVKEPARSVVQAFAALHGNRTVSFTASPSDSLGVHPASYATLKNAVLAITQADDPKSLTPLQKIVSQFDPLFTELLPGSSPLHRAAIWGQALQESNGNPSVIEKPGTNIGGIGLWQHTGSRRRDLEAFASKQSKPWQDTGTQVRFVAQELLGPESHAWTQIQKTTSPEAAAETAMLLYERPATQGGPPTYGTARLDIRVNGTYQALAVIQAAQPGAKTVVDNPPAPTTTTPDQQVNQIAEWIIQQEIPVEQLIRAMAVARGVPGFAVDATFSFLNPFFNGFIRQVNIEQIGQTGAAKFNAWLQGLIDQHKVT